uniref:Uncharacterized protein n=1 Tax=Thermosporothrix sp. COM3 TaxID=2490863 RepID=A0A455SE99_9CHLR|nr:hypothetical protein KTC_01100 [Thermosporothrix sp. COM3]
MSILFHILKWVGPLSGVGAITLGLLHWFFHISFLELHMLFGFLVTLSLLLSGIIALLTRGIRVLGAIALVFVLIVPVFGLTQMLIFIGDFHWLIQIAHLLVGVAAVQIIEKICKHALQNKQKPVIGKKAVSVS